MSSLKSKYVPHEDEEVDLDSSSHSLYLDRCQIDTPLHIVSTVWQKVKERRHTIGEVVDFGAGDARFANEAGYNTYTGYEIDPLRCVNRNLPKNARLVNACAFSVAVKAADVVIGNPPYVRNQDLPKGWRQRAASALAVNLSDIRISGLANAWQYFFLLSLVTAKSDGLVALVIPFEWVSRPASEALRRLIREEGWEVLVYRLHDNTFDRVLTTSSITIIDKRGKLGVWSYFDQDSDGSFRKLDSPSGAVEGQIPYSKSRSLRGGSARVKRGLSTGTQKVFLLTEAGRKKAGLWKRVDVVPCIKSLRVLPNDLVELDADVFETYFVGAGEKCWLVRTDTEPSPRLNAYFDTIDESEYQTRTCLNREVWWHFQMPEVPKALVASGFRGARPKVVKNTIKARAVGGVSGIFGITDRLALDVAERFQEINISDRVVAHSHGLKKLEINQLNSLLDTLLDGASTNGKD